MRPPSIVPNTYVPKFSIGGSDAGAIMGLSKFKTAQTVYDRLVHGLPEPKDNDQMERGRYLEPVGIFKYAQKYPRRDLLALPEPKTHPDYPFLHASADHGVYDPIKKDGILEIKAPGDFVFDQYIDHGIDESYYCQLQHYMFVYDWKWGAFGMFAGGRWKLHDWDVDRDDAFIEKMETECIRFWNENVLKKIPPGLPPVIADFPRAALGGRTVVKKDEEWVTALKILKIVRDDAKAAEAKKKEAEQRVKDLMGEITHVTVPGVGKVSWNESTRRTFDKDAFAADHPEVDLEPYDKLTVVRTFLPTIK